MQRRLLAISIFDSKLTIEISIFVIERNDMSRKKFKTLTEQMYYILLCLRRECCGTDIMSLVREMTDDRVHIGPGTLYNLLERFQEAGMIEETRVEGRKRSYILTSAGENALQSEYERLLLQIRDFDRERLV